MTRGSITHTATGVDAVTAATELLLDALDQQLTQAGDVAEVIDLATMVERRVSAFKLKAIATADAAGTAVDAGMSSTAAWVASRTHVDGGKAYADVALATSLHSDDTPTGGATAQALESGVLSVEHAKVIARALDDLPARLGDNERVQIEESLVATAGRVNPRQLRVMARRALAVVEPDTAVVDAHHNEVLMARDEAALRAASFTMYDNHNGTHSGTFTVPDFEASVLKKALDAMTAPRRVSTSSTNNDGSTSSTTTTSNRGRAFADLLSRIPTDHLSTKTTATIIVTMDHETLREGLDKLDHQRPAGVDTGEELSAGAVRRLACGAGLVPAVLGTASVPLDMGRAARLFTEHQARAIRLSHTTCAGEGCDRPVAWCELHHLQPWSAGGATNLDNAVPLCGFHHRLIHNPKYEHRREAHGTIAFITRRVSTSSTNRRAVA